MGLRPPRAPPPCRQPMRPRSGGGRVGGAWSEKVWPAAGRGGQSESPFSRPASEGRAGRHAPGGRGRTEGRGLIDHAPAPPGPAPLRGRWRWRGTVGARRCGSCGAASPAERGERGRWPPTAPVRLLPARLTPLIPPQDPLPRASPLPGSPQRTHGRASGSGAVPGGQRPRC